MAITRSQVKSLINEIIRRRGEDARKLIELRGKMFADRVYHEVYGSYVETMKQLPKWMFITLDFLDVRTPDEEHHTYCRAHRLSMSKSQLFADRHKWDEVLSLEYNDDRAAELRAISRERQSLEEVSLQARDSLLALIGNCKSVKGIKERWPGIVDEAGDLLAMFDEATPNLPAVRDEDVSAILDKIGQKKAA